MYSRRVYCPSKTTQGITAHKIPDSHSPKDPLHTERFYETRLVRPSIPNTALQLFPPYCPQDLIDHLLTRLLVPIDSSKDHSKDKNDEVED